MASIELYLDKRLDEHCRQHVMNEQGINPDTPEFEEELKSFKRSMRMSIWRDSNIIEIAYYMKIPRKALYRFGYTNEMIDEEFEMISHDRYPY